MRLTINGLVSIITVGVCFSFASAQSQTAKPVAESATQPAVSSSPEGTNGGSGENVTSAPVVWIHLVDGRRLEVDEVTQSADGIWYTRDNLSTFIDAKHVLRVERNEPQPQSIPAESSSSKEWKILDSGKVENFFQTRFKRPLPLAAFGQSDLHDRWGLDHRNGMDVALHPDSPEGKALIEFLREQQIPFLAFRSSVPRVATGPHIHVGNRSARVRAPQ